MRIKYTREKRDLLYDFALKFEIGVGLLVNASLDEEEVFILSVNVHQM